MIEKTFLVNCVPFEWKLSIILLGCFRSEL